MSAKLRIAFICHDDDRLNREILPRWAASFADVVGIVAIREHKNMRWRRLRAEARRVGWLRLLDVFAFRLFYRLFLASRDRAWEDQEIARLAKQWTADVSRTPVCATADPNSSSVVQFLEERRPDLVVARCKWLLRKEVYAIPNHGTAVLHPGVCPEYRNSHGCFWALAQRDMERVGLTLLKIDDGIDTGPVYGYFTYPFDERTESHIRIQLRMVIENLGVVRTALEEMVAGRLQPLDVRGRASKNWGQPWLTRYLRWKRLAGS